MVYSPFSYRVGPPPHNAPFPGKQHFFNDRVLFLTSMRGMQCQIVLDTSSRYLKSRIVFHFAVVIVPYFHYDIQIQNDSDSIFTGASDAK